jgi:ribokinase
MFVVIGTTTVDLYISGIDKMPRFEGDEFTSNSLSFCNRPLTMTLGGNGANSAYVLASLGAPTALCSAAGRDLLGDTVAGWLQAKGVDLRGFVRSEQHSTATDTILIDDSLNRFAFYHPGYLHDLSFDLLPADLFREVTTLLITGYSLLPGLQPEGHMAALQAAKQVNALTALDIGPAIGRPATLSEIKPLLPLVDYLITNAYELTVCTGADTIAAGVQQVLDAGANAVLVHRGASGASVSRAQQPPIDARGFPVEAAVTVGAGDVFNAAFLFALNDGMTDDRALEFANAAASMVVASGRSVLGTPTRSQIQTFLDGVKN